MSLFKRKRTGSILPMALVIALVGAWYISLIFDRAGSFLGVTSSQRITYMDEIVAANYIEQVKGSIVARNLSNIASGGSVLHGQENGEIPFLQEYPPLSGIEGLRVDSADTSLNQVINVQGGGGNRRVEVRVYDANYSTHRIKESSSFSPADFDNLPPSFFISGNSGSGQLVNTGNSGLMYEEIKSSGGNLGDIYKRYGAYLIQVRISDPERPDVPIRITEEVFIHVIKP